MLALAIVSFLCGNRGGGGSCHKIKRIKDHEYIARVVTNVLDIVTIVAVLQNTLNLY